MPQGLSELVICGAHGAETILVDQDMNRVHPDARIKDDASHCGLCTLVFGLAWGIALIFGLALFAFYLPPHRNDGWRPQHNGFTLALPRAPPLFA